MKVARPVIVVGVVGEQPSLLRFAAREAAFAGARLSVVHAAALTPKTAAACGIEILDSARATGQFILDDAKEFVKFELGDPDAEYVLSDEGPIVALEQAASGASMLIVGSDDVPWYDRLLRTKIAGYMALHAPCPVVVVPEFGYPDSMEGELVVTLDGLSAAKGPLRYAFEQASARDCVLHVLSAVPPATMAADAADLRANMSEILAGWRERFPDVAVLEGWVVGSPREVVARATSGAELVVVGRPHLSSMPFPISRPLAMDVLRRANCPVAVVPVTYGGVL